MESKSEIEATSINLGRNLISFFQNLEKYRASRNTKRKVIHDAQEITDDRKINNHIFLFYEKLFEERLQNDSKKLLEFLKDTQFHH